ncbi:hypothetical protein E2F48_15065 [Arthrobacter crusticola]|uniref:Uncharacterized protein n=1 Tax=Arthrobacter crusticola TaxID=2547960 RepID=A0A4V3ALR9_9MICC|nr:hypothetical protein [Arthrobacter crusticola]TDK24096.1 hypothetical protein E2F48_15065 [Arthrobacter crusticola]
MMRIYLYVSAGLLAAAAITSALLDNWDILVGIGLGLASVLAVDLLGNRLSDWSYRYSEETERHREALVGKQPVQTTYYYDDEDDIGTSPSPEEPAAEAAESDRDEQTR